MKNRPNKNALVPPYFYVTEGYDPIKLNKMNEEIQRNYDAKKLITECIFQEDNIINLFLPRRNNNGNVT